MSVLLITAEVQDQIDAAVARARATPTPLEFVTRFGSPDNRPTYDLADRPRDFPGTPTPPQSVLIPNGFRAAISFEHQPNGLCRHLSVSSPTGLPNAVMLTAIANAFGFSMTPGSGRSRLWVEEYEPGQRAVNVVEFV